MEMQRGGAEICSFGAYTVTIRRVLGQQTTHSAATKFTTRRCRAESGAVGHDETIDDEAIIFVGPGGGSGFGELQQRGRTDTGQHH
ncbi:hypothetical protein [Mesorhizobium sp.]|uniref:hypothetical protein n=1 Tax=Mesorhizobium sp. TaxID=1871066 RepID=UPI0025C43B0C|nr:hypothetical protein [Mesorhizobium sp.]